MRPFSASAEVECRGYSEGLQRAMTDFGAEEAGERLAVCALQAGAGRQTKIHGVGDGAVWITEQMEAQFGAQANYLVDFPHVCEYMSAAAEVIAAKDKSAWRKEKQDWLKDN